MSTIDAKPTPAARAGSRSTSTAARLRRFGAAWGLHAVLVAISFTLVLPFVWLILTSVKPLEQVGVGSWLPTRPSVYKAGDVVKTDELADELAASTDPRLAEIRASMSSVLENLPARPWTEAKTEQAQKSLATGLTSVIDGAVKDDRVLFAGDIADLDIGEEGRQTLERLDARRTEAAQARTAAQQAELHAKSLGVDADGKPTTPEAEAAMKQASRLRKQADRAEADYQAGLGLLNRRILDALLGGRVRPTHTVQIENYAEVFRQIPFGRYYMNSIFIAACVTFLQVFTSSMAAFAFSRLTWPGRDKVFVLYLSTMMLPGLVMMIPNYQIMITLGWVDQFTGLIVPAAFTAFGTFLLRQFMLTIPKEMDEAAEIDGAGKWRVFWDVILPMARPGLITLAIFTFMGNYHSFFWPLVMLKSEHKLTLPIGLLYFDSSAGQVTNLLMAAVAMSVLPMIIVFVTLQKYLVKGIQLGAVKG